jgi:epoxyqueuosine reductase QueG
MTDGRTGRLKAVAQDAGADLCGIADLAAFRSALPVVPGNLIDGFRFALSAAIRLDDAVVSAITDHPTAAYAALYRDANMRLDRIAGSAAAWLTGQGYRAHAIPASHISDEEQLLGAISHKAVAHMAGLGWQGKSLLIVNPDHGPRIRLVTVLTDMPLIPDGPVRNRCGSCGECAKACPAGAIKNVPTRDHYETREAAVDLAKCHGQVKAFAARTDIGARICGVCVRACPFGKRCPR